MTVGITIFGAILGERKVDLGIVFQTVIAKLVEGVKKGKATPIGPYLFHLYVGHEVLLLGEVVTYDIRLQLLKYNYTPDLEPNEDTSLRSDPNPEPSPPVRHSNWKSRNQAGSSQSRDNRGEGRELTQWEIDDTANSFPNAIQ